MQDIKIKKEELLTKLRENREKHESDFIAAKDAFRETMVKELRARAKSISAGGSVDLGFHNFPAPKSYLEDYDEAISVFEMEIRQEVELEFNDFRRYVLDKWDWQRQFAGTNSLYSSG